MAFFDDSSKLKVKQSLKQDSSNNEPLVDQNCLVIISGNQSGLSVWVARSLLYKIYKRCVSIPSPFKVIF